MSDHLRLSAQKQVHQLHGDDMPIGLHEKIASSMKRVQLTFGAGEVP